MNVKLLLAVSRRAHGRAHITGAGSMPNLNDLRLCPPVRTEAPKLIGTTPDGYAADIAAIISQASPRSRLSRLARFSLEYREHPSTMNRTNFYRAFLRWLCLKIEEQCGDIEGLAV